jgi:hypothetical protein
VRVKFLVLLARLVGKLIGILSRTQTRLLSRAQYHGWMPSDFEAQKLMRKQTLLFNWNMARKALKKLKPSERI